jgi:carbonic anhydrase/acetyltransferase-like protein (isoleucine patch superfamily)
MIHTTAIVHEGAEIHESVEIGPYAIVGPHVKIGAGTTVGPHAVLDGRTEIGENNQIFHHASIGAVPQHAKYRGEPTRLTIGSENIIREFVTIHLGTVEDRSITIVGSHIILMAYAHVAHDCTLEDAVILANAATLGGHVYVERNAIVGGLVGVHQFVRTRYTSFCEGLGRSFEVVRVEHRGPGAKRVFAGGDRPIAEGLPDPVSIRGTAGVGDRESSGRIGGGSERRIPYGLLEEERERVLPIGKAVEEHP